MSKDIRVHTNFRIPVDLANQLDIYAVKMGVSRTQLMINLLRSGVEDLSLLNSVGLLAIGRGARELADKLRHGEISVGAQTSLPL